jgi:YHS domain-containing protein
MSRTGLALSLTTLLLAAVPTLAATGMICPVTGRQARQELSLRHGDTAYFFSSKAAMTLFKLSPARYVKRASEAGKQTTCPVMGGAIDDKVFTDHEGRRIYFCCPGCIETFKADPARYLAIVDAALRPVVPPPTPAKPDACGDGCTGHAPKAPAAPKKPAVPDACGAGCSGH